MVKLFDCTIRDGGHLNGWNFTKECVKASYNAALKSGAEFFEVGYRFDAPKPEWGDFAKCEDNFLLSFLEKNDKCKFSVMIDAGKCSLEKFQEHNSKKTLLDIVRIAVYPDKLDIAFKLAEGLNKKGYEVFINFMAISKYSEEHFRKIQNWTNKSVLKAVCFADSFGSFLPKDVAYYGNKLRDCNFENICFHSHNNLQLAFANSLRAIEEKFYSIDVSIYGMGRAAGILPAELITGYLKEVCKDDKYNPIAYVEVIEQFYLEHMKKTPWGYKIQSLIGGLKNIHPNYVNQLFDNKDLTTEKIWEISNLIKQNAPISHNIDEIHTILNDYVTK